jgi:hypothetical protein
MKRQKLGVIPIRRGGSGAEASAFSDRQGAIFAGRTE